MKNEFARFGLAKWGLFTIILEILGALGLLVGMLYQPILLLSCGGLSLLMLFGLLARIKSKDSLRLSLPALFYMALNAFIFYVTINL